MINKKKTAMNENYYIISPHFKLCDNLSFVEQKGDV